MGVLLYAIFGFGTQLIASAPHSIVTVFDFTNCYGAPPVALPCERVAYRAGALNAALNAWWGLLLIAVAAWLVWDLWSAAAPKPITDDFLRLLDDSFARSPRSEESEGLSARVLHAHRREVVGTVCSGDDRDLIEPRSSPFRDAARHHVWGILLGPVASNRSGVLTPSPISAVTL